MQGLIRIMLVFIKCDKLVKEESVTKNSRKVSGIFTGTGVPKVPFSCIL